MLLKRTFQPSNSLVFFSPFRRKFSLMNFKTPPAVLTGSAKNISWLKLFGGVMAFNTLTFAAASHLDDFGIVDITWGLMFLIPNTMLMYNRRNSLTKPMLLLYTMSTAWALRLSYHIGSRHKGEDWRYQYILKPRWQDKPLAERIATSYLWVFGLQGLCCMINNASVMYVLKYSQMGSKIGKIEVFGLLVWLLGQAIE
jgi:steroid 5-alpha reductase family enzyme